MNSLAFDTHKAVKALTQAGVTEPLAEAVVATVGDALGKHAATKDDIAGVKKDMESMEQRLNVRIDGLEQRLNVRIDGLEQSLNVRIDGLEQSLNVRIENSEQRLIANMDILKQNMTIRLGTMVAAGVGVLAALMTLFQFGLN